MGQRATAGYYFAQSFEAFFQPDLRALSLKIVAGASGAILARRDGGKWSRDGRTENVHKVVNIDNFADNSFVIMASDTHLGAA